MMLVLLAVQALFLAGCAAATVKLFRLAHHH